MTKVGTEEWEGAEHDEEDKRTNNHSGECFQSLQSGHGP